jgi:hypothetical protein
MSALQRNSTNALLHSDGKVIEINDEESSKY